MPAKKVPTITLVIHLEKGEGRHQDPIDIGNALAEEIEGLGSFYVEDEDGHETEYTVAEALPPAD